MSRVEPVQQPGLLQHSGEESGFFIPRTVSQARDFPFYSKLCRTRKCFGITESCLLILITFKLAENDRMESPRRFSSLPGKSLRFMPHPFQALSSHTGWLVCCFNRLSQNRSKYPWFSRVQNVYVFSQDELSILHIRYLQSYRCESKAMRVSRRLP